MITKSKYSLLNQLNELQKIANIYSEPYRAKAFRHAYSEVLNIDNISADSLMKLDVGSSMKKKFDEFIKKGEISEINERKNDPLYSSISSLHSVIGVGSNTIKKWKEIGITDVSSLQHAVDSGKITLNHMQKIGLKYHKDLNVPIPRSVIDDLVTSLNKVKSLCEKFEVAGSYRRGKPESNDVDIIVVSSNFDSVINVIKSMDMYVDFIINGHERFSFVCVGSHGRMIQVDILNVPASSYIYALMYFTGSVYFNEYIRGAARSAGMKLNQHGLYKDKIAIECKDEEEIFKKIGVDFTPVNKR